MIVIPVNVNTDGRASNSSVRGKLLTRCAGVPFGLALIQTAGREDLLVKYGSAIEDTLGDRPKPKFRNIDADNWMYIGAKPEDNNKAEDPSS
jgi:hypothetical protein